MSLIWISVAALVSTVLNRPVAWKVRNITSREGFRLLCRAWRISDVICIRDMRLSHRSVLKWRRAACSRNTILRPYTAKMGSAGSSKALVPAYQTTRSHTLQNTENLEHTFVEDGVRRGCLGSKGNPTYLCGCEWHESFASVHTWTLSVSPQLRSKQIGTTMLPNS